VHYGYRRIHVLLRREGWPVNAKRAYPSARLLRSFEKTVDRPARPNDIWAMDFLLDQLFDGRKIRVLTIVDAYSKVSPAIDARARYTGAMLLQHSNVFVWRTAYRRPFVWTMDLSSSPAISICGPTGTA
jgi:transposase InsO family protein